MCQLQFAVDHVHCHREQNNHAEFRALVADFCSLHLVVEWGTTVFAATVNRYKGCADLSGHVRRCSDDETIDCL